MPRLSCISGVNPVDRVLQAITFVYVLQEEEASCCWYCSHHVIEHRLKCLQLTEIGKLLGMMLDSLFTLPQTPWLRIQEHLSAIFQHEFYTCCM